MSTVSALVLLFSYHTSTNSDAGSGTTGPLPAARASGAATTTPNAGERPAPRWRPARRHAHHRGDARPAPTPGSGEHPLGAGQVQITVKDGKIITAQAVQYPTQTARTNRSTPTPCRNSTRKSSRHRAPRSTRSPARPSPATATSIAAIRDRPGKPVSSRDRPGNDRHRRPAPACVRRADHGPPGQCARSRAARRPAVAAAVDAFDALRPGRRPVQHLEPRQPGQPDPAAGTGSPTRTHGFARSPRCATKPASAPAAPSRRGYPDRTASGSTRPAWSKAGPSSRP